MSLNDKSVIVTGGQGNLGRAVVNSLTRQGARCYVADATRRESGGFEFAARVRVTGGLDLAEEAQVAEFYESVPNLWASIHLAGGFHMGAIRDTSKDVFMAQIIKNALTCFLCSREAVKRMTEGGRIVNVVSRQALEPRIGGGATAYTASKSAILGFTQALAEEVISQGIFVNAIAPAILDTPPNREAMPDADHSQWPRVEEVAQTIEFLVSPLNTTIRGGIIPVYGRV